MMKCMYVCMSHVCLFCWKNDFGRWENYFVQGRWENNFGKWENLFGTVGGKIIFAGGKIILAGQVGK